MARRPLVIAILLAVGVVGLGGCAPWEKLRSTQFRQVSSSEYTYKVLYNASGPVAGTSTEDQRRTWLGEEMTERNACPKGYDVARDESLYSEGTGGRQMEVVYGIRCKA